MKLPSLVAALAVFSSAADAGTPPAQPATPAEVRQGPMEVRQAPVNVMLLNRPASWQRIEQAKLQYNVFRQYAPADLVPQLEQPVANPAYRDLVAQRAAAFRSGARSLKLAINANTLIDAGALRAEDAGTVVLVDLAGSPGLLESLKADLLAQKELKLDVSEEKNYVVPTFASTFARADGTSAAYRSSDSLMVTIAAKNHSRVTVLRLENGVWKRVSDSAAGAVVESPQALRAKLQQRRAVFYKGYERVLDTTAAVAKPRIDLVNLNQLFDMRQLQRMGAGTSPSQPGSGTTVPAPEPTPLPTPPARPPSYTSYGVTPTCSRQCEKGNCIACCAAVMSAEHSAIGAAGFACHMSSDLCPWCHIGCAIMVTAMWHVAAIHDTTCVIGCGVRSEIPVSRGNPNHCPVH